MSFSNLTIVSVTGAEAYTESSMWAVARSCRELPGAKGLLISPNRPASLPANIQHQPCKPFGYFEYSIFITYCLAQYIHTDYCLVVQNDGWVLNGKNWRSEFWDYDYIGALILTSYRVEKDEQGRIHLDGRCYTKALNEPSEYFHPLNGGFSLRSKRFLEMPRQLGLTMPIVSPNTVAEDQPFYFDWGSAPVHSEDLFLTVAVRKELEEAGMRFAPHWIANQFSFESSAALEVWRLSYRDYLGHHFFKEIKIVSMDHVEMSMPRRQFDLDNFYLKSLLDTFVDCGYTVNVTLLD